MSFLRHSSKIFPKKMISQYLKEEEEGEEEGEEDKQSLFT